MNLPYRIVPLCEGQHATLYTVRVDGRPDTETELFSQRPEVRAAKEFHPLERRRHAFCGREHLYHRHADADPHRWFRDEGDGCSALCAPIPSEDEDVRSGTTSVLRLYCFRLDREALKDHLHLLDPADGRNLPIAVFCGGGLKTTLQPRDCPNVAASFNEMKHVKRRLVERLSTGDVRISEDLYELEGDLSFCAKP